MDRDCEFCTPAAARGCLDPTCRARGYGHTAPDSGDRDFTTSGHAPRTTDRAVWTAAEGDG